ncbi:MAG: M4 family metallopeptidase [Gemmatimonadetes bacterium]|nr:M4 family metallopeptidase [Gemmatimonadota bacterium]
MLHNVRSGTRLVPWPATHALAGVGLMVLVAGCTPGGTSGLELLRRDAVGRMDITENPLTGTASFIRGRIPVAVMGPVGGAEMSLAQVFMNRYAGIFGIDMVQGNLQYFGEAIDSLGTRHVTLRQFHQAIEVYEAEMTVHSDREGTRVVAVTNSTIPDLQVDIARPRIDVMAATRVARRFMPGGEVVSSDLRVYPGRLRASSARLVWLVELRDDDAPARRAYAVSARDGEVVDVLDRLYVARNRRTHTANHEFGLPGTLRRSEGDGPVGDKDVDNVHDFAGETYDYFHDTHGRDSYDNLGAALSSTAHYRVNFQNAFWNGMQMVYGDGYAVKDVAAHEMTHAVTENAARLEYRWQSGALNESFSDIFAAMVDRDNWLIGEDLPNGPIRNMEDPTEFNHPGHTDDWRGMCGDNEGVHINSGIHNKAYVNVATAIGKDRAEQIFYRALTIYLKSQSTFEDARSAALQSAADLFGDGSADAQAVDKGFADVGVDGSFEPGPGGCGTDSSSDSSFESVMALLALVIGAVGLYTTIRRPMGA